MNLYRGGNILVISRRVIQVDEKAEKEGLPCRGKKKNGTHSEHSVFSRWQGDHFARH